MLEWLIQHFPVGIFEHRCVRFSKIACFTLVVFLWAIAIPETAGAIISSSQRTFRESHSRFEHLSFEHGLTQSSVRCILQDSRGFLWFGTDDGLHRYDGYGFKVYRTDPDDPHTISSNIIRVIYEDHVGTLWLGTHGGGLNQFDHRTERFVRYQNDPDNPASLSNDYVWTILQDREGSLWIGTDSGLNQLLSLSTITDEAKSGAVNFRHHHRISGDPHSLSHNHILALCEDSSGMLWVGTQGGGLNQMVMDNDRRTTRFISYKHDPQNSASLSSDYIRALCGDRTGILWIGTNDGGLNKLMLPAHFDESETPTFVRYRHLPNQPRSLSHDDVLTVFQDYSGSLWIGADGGGLNKLISDRTEGSPAIFRHYTHNPADRGSLSNGHILAITQDRSGILWIGTQTGGANKLDPHAQKFHPIRKSSAKDGLNDNMIWAFAEDHAGAIWVGTQKGGLNKYSWPLGRESGPYVEHFQKDLGTLNSLTDNHVRTIFQDRNGTLWLGTDKGGLSRLDPETETFTHYRHDPGNPASLSSDAIYSIHEDKNGMLWVGTRTGGLNKFNPDTEQFTHYKYDPADPKSVSDDFIYKIYEDSAGTLWLGTYTGGINWFVQDAHNGLPLRFQNYKHDPADPQSLSNNCVLTIYEDRAGRLWFGTAGGGLNSLIRNENSNSEATFIRYSEKEGLPSNFVYGILEDDDGFLWLSTNTGLSKFDPVTKTFKNYDARDGLQSNEFNGGAYFRDSTGQMFFGGINGLNAFYPEDIRDNPYIPPVVITDVLLSNRPIPIGPGADGRLILEQSLTETESIQLSYRDNVFSFEFAALNFSNPEKNQYRYMMEGFDENWLDAGTRRFVTYTNLNPGDYIFRVTGSNNDGVWNEEGTSLRITIHPPFWRELWFIVAGGSIFLLLIYAGYRRRMVRIEKRKAELESQVQEKTESAEALQNALAEVERLKNRLQAENIYLQNEIGLVHNFENIVTRSEKLKQVLRSVEKVAATDATVLILGESGTGKELLARAVHRISDRGDRPLVKVNCSALPANLIESELFGHEKGAFTGAIAKKIGRYELANGGTIFLDEIADLPLELQAKLLRVLQEGEFERLGSPNTIKVDVRVIAATNRDLEQEIEHGNFREDLFYRLNVFPITIPPLRERKEDIPILVSHFVHIYGRKIGKKIESIPKHVLHTLEKYDWPGNVRELENIIERAVIVSPGKQLVVGDWLHEHGVLHSLSHGSTLEEIERKHIIEILEMTGWRVSGEKGAAKILGLNPKTLDSKMRKLHIKRK